MIHMTLGSSADSTWKSIVVEILWLAIDRGLTAGVNVIDGEAET
jgi:hypothetical protein